MPLWTPPGALYREQRSWTTPVTTMGVLVTASGTAHTKGAWAQLIASTSFETLYITVGVNDTTTSAANTAMLLDIGIGAAAAETVIIPDLLAGFAGGPSVSGQAPVRVYEFPLRIPSATRISARVQSAVISKTARVFVTISGEPRYPGLVWAGGKVTAYGITAAASGGTSVTPGASGAEGSWTTISASTGEDTEVLVVGCQGSLTATLTSMIYTLDAGVGAAAAEQALTSDRWIHCLSSEWAMGPWPTTPIGVCVPSGSRLAARASGHTTSPQAMDIALYGIS